MPEAAANPWSTSVASCSTVDSAASCVPGALVDVDASVSAVIATGLGAGDPVRSGCAVGLGATAGAGLVDVDVGVAVGAAVGVGAGAGAGVGVAVGVGVGVGVAVG